jgi:hypothetical protein
MLPCVCIVPVTCLPVDVLRELGAKLNEFELRSRHDRSNDISSCMQVPPAATVHLLTRAVSAPAASLDSKQAPVQLRVAFEDDHVGVVIKPQGMQTMRSGPSDMPRAAECIKYALTMPAVPGAPRHACHHFASNIFGTLHAKLMPCAMHTPRCSERFQDAPTVAKCGVSF